MKNQRCNNFSYAKIHPTLGKMRNRRGGDKSKIIFEMNIFDGPTIYERILNCYKKYFRLAWYQKIEALRFLP